MVNITTSIKLYTKMGAELMEFSNIGKLLP
ncbi:hypothetical protein TICRE_24950 [Tissierella creatinophila DSM 6911]|uniref:Uncharacterized protein n=1 Tax=Tissierella creatinophila DSM 6911 TaxID=1123403 RepID=A0A1U7M2D6_TISCR|nr:hypothetical protein TICRE_24950 [Tissierella creatinophila DSM 6911]